MLEYAQALIDEADDIPERHSNELRLMRQNEKNKLRHKRLF